MTPAREASICANIRQALLKLASGTIYTREELFGKPASASDEGRVRKILLELGKRELIESKQLKHSEPKLHLAKDAAGLRAIAENDLELTRLIWPGRAPGASFSALTRGLQTLMQIEPTPITVSAPAEQAPEPNMNETILKLLGAMIENLIYLRGKVDALSAVACAHCECPEAHR